MSSNTITSASEILPSYLRSSEPFSPFPSNLSTLSTFSSLSDPSNPSKDSLGSSHAGDYKGDRLLRDTFTGSPAKDARFQNQRQQLQKWYSDSSELSIIGNNGNISKPNTSRRSLKRDTANSVRSAPSKFPRSKMGPKAKARGFRSLLRELTTKTSLASPSLSAKDHFLSSIDTSKYDQKYVDNLWEAASDWAEDLHIRGRKFRINKGEWISTVGMNLDAFKASIATQLLRSDDAKSKTSERRVERRVEESDGMVRFRDKGNAWNLNRRFKRNDASQLC
ncbi:hypothetical protein I204_06246 [Kwoniella mangroviensis CBS 8886]|uniref:uncharacterized protein n=1 Tax=Kwoniella mangroviensis CBS 8507 TaxID=1296122 RepID=UPI00080D4E76|nr:uncharacterized protein I203_03468 [Kwoniella mangroviensis CBS 8507]OCF67770.1 hypothetical protein I203_03468 [Kwoniella mangroviensis CBS 8507]OCF73016.1 hypothetical protein I204_06246 [Kwoniella mangroviensis CBS 8886]